MSNQVSCVLLKQQTCLSSFRAFLQEVDGDRIYGPQLMLATDEAVEHPQWLRFCTEVLVTHTIRFRRPETAYSISRMFVSGEASAEAQVRHLERLGYTVVDVSPALIGQHILQLSEQQMPARP